MARKERSWRRWELAGLFVVLILGNLLHFAYEWADESFAVALFAPVNESTWEHMRLFIIPWVLWSIVELIALRGQHLPILSSRAMGALLGAVFIPAGYYTYRSALGVDKALVNVLLFQAAAILAYWLCTTALRKNWFAETLWQVLGGLVLLGLWTLAVLWTLDPPAAPLFVDPTTGKKGIPIYPI